MQKISKYFQHNHELFWWHGCPSRELFPWCSDICSEHRRRALWVLIVMCHHSNIFHRYINYRKRWYALLCIDQVHPFSQVCRCPIQFTDFLSVEDKVKPLLPWTSRCSLFPPKLFAPCSPRPSIVQRGSKTILVKQSSPAFLGIPHMRCIQLFSLSDTLEVMSRYISDVPSVITLAPLSDTCLSTYCRTVTSSWNTFVLCLPPPPTTRIGCNGAPLMADRALLEWALFCLR